MTGFHYWEEGAARLGRRTVMLLLVVMLVVMMAACGNDPASPSPAAGATTTPVDQTYFIFGTIISVRVYNENVTDEHFAEIENILNQVDLQLNRENPDSEVALINRNAGAAAVPVSAPVYDAVRISLEFAEETDGLFDPTVGVLVDVWGMNDGATSKPEDAAIQQALGYVDYRDVVLDEAAQTVFLARSGMSLDIGGIGKGIAADHIADYLLSEGFDSAIIDMGGNLLTMGIRPDGNLWTLGIQNPNEARGAYVGTIRVDDRAVVASGIYERYFYEDGVRYHHLMDTSTGYPTENELASVTIISDTATQGEGLDNIAFNLGLEEGLRYIDDLADVEAIFITRDNQVYTSSGLVGSLNMTNSDFTLVER